MAMSPPPDDESNQWQACGEDKTNPKALFNEPSVAVRGVCGDGKAFFSTASSVIHHLHQYAGGRSDGFNATLDNEGIGGKPLVTISVPVKNGHTTVNVRCCAGIVEDMRYAFKLLDDQYPKHMTKLRVMQAPPLVDIMQNHNEVFFDAVEHLEENYNATLSQFNESCLFLEFEHTSAEKAQEMAADIHNVTGIFKDFAQKCGFPSENVTVEAEYEFVEQPVSDDLEEESMLSRVEAIQFEDLMTVSKRRMPLFTDPDLDEVTSQFSWDSGCIGDESQSFDEEDILIGDLNQWFAEQDILKVSKEELESWTEGMVEVSAVDMVVKKFKAGQRWVTITGNAGDGKTTVGYLVLRSYRTKDMYVVNTAEELSHISKLKTDCMILLDNSFGTFTFDKVAFDRWLPHIKRILDTHENASENCKPYVLLISRWNVLQSAREHLGRLVKILDKQCVVNLGEMKVVKEERLGILNYHLNRKHIPVPESVKQRVVTHHAPHGFAHCCKMYVELSKDQDVDIEDFFTKPLLFLHQTTRVLLNTPDYKRLFQTIIKDGGSLAVSNIDDDTERDKLTTASSDLKGSYIQEISGTVQFSNQSISESVMGIIAQKDILFIIKYASLSVLRQKVHIKNHDNDVKPGYWNINKTSGELDAFAMRFRNEILKRDFNVFTERFCDDPDFCESLLKLCMNASLSSDEVVGKLGINDKDRLGHTMLWTAVRHGRHAATNVLVELGADVRIPDKHGQTPLHCTCKSASADVSTIQLLISHGANVMATDKYGKTPLHHACKSASADVSTIQLLITQGANVMATDKHGQTPLHYACKSASADVGTIQLLITQGANVMAIDKYGQTPLHYACNSGSADVGTIQLLITQGANVMATDKCGQTPLHYACKSASADVSTIMLLIAHGADINSSFWDGTTPHLKARGMGSFVSLFLRSDQEDMSFEVRQKVCGLRNSGGGILVIHKQMYAEFVDSLLPQCLEACLLHDELHDDVYQIEEKDDVTVISVSQCSKLITVNYHTKIALEKSLTNPTRGNMVRLIHRGNAWCISEAKIRGQSRDLKNGKTVAFKEQMYTESVTDTSQFVKQLFADLNLRDYISAFSKNKDGGSYILPLNVADEQELKSALQDHIMENMIVLDTSHGQETRWSRPPDDLTTIVFHLPESIQGKHLEVSVRPFHGIVFCDKEGPESYKMNDQRQLVRLTKEEWLDGMSE